MAIKRPDEKLDSVTIPSHASLTQLIGDIFTDRHHPDTDGESKIEDPQNRHHRERHSQFVDREILCALPTVECENGVEEGIKREVGQRIGHDVLGCSLGLGVIPVGHQGGQETSPDARGSQGLLNGHVDHQQEKEIRHSLDQSQAERFGQHLE